MSTLILLPAAAEAAWEDVPADKIIAGTPRTRTITLYESPAAKL